MDDPSFRDQFPVEWPGPEHLHVAVDGAIANARLERGVDGAAGHGIEDGGREPPVHAAERVEVAAVAISSSPESIDTKALLSRKSRRSFIRHGETSADAMREKARFVLAIMQNRMKALGGNWNRITTIDVYTAQPIHGIVEEDILRLAGPAAVHDWDRACALPEAAMVGLAASMFPTTDEVPGASIDDTQSFLDAYAVARGQGWTEEERELAWAATLWVMAFSAKGELLDDRVGPATKLLVAERDGRLQRAGA